MDSLARRLALSNVVDLAMQQKNGDVLRFGQLAPLSRPDNKTLAALGVVQRRFRCHGTYENQR